MLRVRPLLIGWGVAGCVGSVNRSGGVGVGYGTRWAGGPRKLSTLGFDFPFGWYIVNTIKNSIDSHTSTTGLFDSMAPNVSIIHNPPLELFHSIHALFPRPLRACPLAPAGHGP